MEELTKINGRYLVCARLQIGRQPQLELQERLCRIHFLWLSAFQRVTEKKVSHLKIFFISIEGIRIIVFHVNVHPSGELAAQPKEDAAELHVGPINVDIHVNGLSRLGRHRVLVLAAVAAAVTHHKPDWAKVRIGRANAGVAAKVRQKPGDKHLDAPGIIGGHYRVPVDIGIGHARLGQGILVSIPQMLKYRYGV